MWLKFSKVWTRLSCALLLASTAYIASNTASAAMHPEQNPDTMLPEQRVAKAREILNQLTEALGGPAYLEVRERECDGRRAQFGHASELIGFIDFKDYWRYPDKHRIDYSKKGNIIDAFDGNQGWTMDRAGVSEEPAQAVSDFAAAVKYNVDNVLRFGLKDQNLNLNYAGQGIIDMRPVDWVEISDDQRTLRLGIDRSSHLLLQSVMNSVDANTQERLQETTIYTNYQRIGGVMVALQVSRERNGERNYQAFYDTCTFDPHLPADMFTKAALEKRYAQVGNKKDKDRYRNARD
ncbi:MAG TPA: hypothetical protein VN850_01665 [Candidatus Acidoferrales bacterium]|nr:hypothetical protein [Candidatus Acidoferrales bacterium]